LTWLDLEKCNITGVQDCFRDGAGERSTGLASAGCNKTGTL